MTTRKFKQILSSIKEIGLIEPLSVIATDEQSGNFLLLDGNLRVLALKELGEDHAPKQDVPQGDPLEKIVKLEKEMSQVQTQYKDAEANYGSDLLNLVVAKGYLSKLTADSKQLGTSISCTSLP